MIKIKEEYIGKSTFCRSIGCKGYDGTKYLVYRDTRMDGYRYLCSGCSLLGGDYCYMAVEINNMKKYKEWNFIKEIKYGHFLDK